MDENKEEVKERTKDVIIDEQTDFKSMLLSESTISGLETHGFIKPSPIQLKAIPLGRCGFDLIVKSKSGTGKTAVFGIVALEMINLNKNDVQVLILAPTREIAVQISEVIKSIGVKHEGLKTECFIGGLSFEDDIKKAQNCHIAIGAPGRIKHLIDKNHLLLDHLKLFVLDEADKLMQDSYQSDINHIFHKLPLMKQMIVTSATYPDGLDDFLTKYMHTPMMVTPNVDSPLLLGLKHYVSIVTSNASVIQQMRVKTEEIIRILSKVSFTQCLIFSNFQSRAESTCNILNGKGWKSTYVSAAQTQTERLKAIQQLKDFEYRILFSTDLTARGIDAINVDLVINMDVPHDASTYLHRMGRAGRYGSKGICITIAIKGKELDHFQNIIGMIGGVNFSIAELPDDSEFPDNLWESDYGKFKQIYGSINNESPDEKTLRIKSIKKSILELKQEKKENLKEAKSKEEEEKHQEFTQLKKSEDEENEMACSNEENKANEIEDDTMLILEKLARGELHDIPVENDESKKLVSPEPEILGTTKRKFKEGKIQENFSDVRHVEKRKPTNDPSLIYQKNVTLFNSTRLLHNLDVSEKETDEFAKSIEKYLAKLKEEDNEVSEDLQNLSCSDILSRINHPREFQVKGSLEEIFTYSYDYIIKPNQPHWLEAVGGKIEETEMMSQENKINLLDNSSQDECGDEEDYEEEEVKDFNVIDKSSNKQFAENGNVTKYCDYVPGLYTGHEYSQMSTYSGPFQQCIDLLDEQVYEFEDVPSLHNWFYHWQQQVEGVRDYVQQHIYLQEMNRYQYYSQNK